MKCSVAEDLLVLYVDDMCSDETKKEIEEHLTSCEKCSEKLQNYKAEIKVDDWDGAEPDNRDQAVKASMKKVKRKLSIRKAAAVISSLLLLVVVIGVGCLMIGERIGNSMNFSTIFNIMTLKRVAKSICDRDFEPLLTITHYDLDSMYIGNSIIKDNGTTIRDVQREKLERAFQDTFGDAKVKCKIVNINYEYENDFFTGVSEDYEMMNDLRNPSGSIMFRFFNDSEELYVTFFQHADRKFTYIDSDYTQNVDKIKFESISCDEVIAKIIARAIKMNNINLRPWNLLIYQKREAAAESETDIKMDERVAELVEKGWNISEFYFEADGFDFDEYCVIYKVHFILQNEVGDTSIMEQRFEQQNSHFYIRKDEPAVMIITADSMSEETKELALNMFTVNE